MLLNHAFTGCDTASGFFGYGKKVQFRKRSSTKLEVAFTLTNC